MGYFLDGQKMASVLNLIINGLSSKHMAREASIAKIDMEVLNLIINGLSSKPLPKG